MTERERLAELLAECITIRECSFAEDKRPTCEELADYLIKHGVCYIPYKRNQEIWVIDKGYIHLCIVCDIIPHARSRHLLRLDDTTDQRMLDVDLELFSECCYFTREAAEAALAERRGKTT